MASTRQATGNSKPRVFPKVEEAAATAVKKATGKKRGPKKTTGATATKGTKAKAKANTSKPRAKKVSTDKVTKPAAKKTAAPKKTSTTAVKKAPAVPTHEPTIMEKISGAILKVEGAILGKPGKKAAGTAKIRGTGPGKKAATKA